MTATKKHPLELTLYMATFSLDEQAAKLTIALLGHKDYLEYDLVLAALRAAYRAGLEHKQKSAC